MKKAIEPEVVTFAKNALRLAATISGLVLPSLAFGQTVVPVDHDWSNEAGWHVYYNESNEKSCFAESRPADGEAFVLGVSGVDGVLFVGVASERTAAFGADESHKVTLDFAGGNSWNAPMFTLVVGGTTMLFGGFPKADELRREIAAAAALVVKEGKRKLADVSLKGTSAAFKAIDACLSAMREGKPETAPILVEQNGLKDKAKELFDAGHYAEAEPLYRQALATNEGVLRENDHRLAQSRNDLAWVLFRLDRRDEALGLARSAALAGYPDRNLYLALLDAPKSAVSGVAESFEAIQLISRSATASALQAVAARTAAGGGALSAAVRAEQDAVKAVQHATRELFGSYVDGKPNESFWQAYQAAVDKRDRLQQSLAEAFPEYWELMQPKPLSLASAQALLGPDEALIIVDVPKGEQNYVWIVTDKFAKWRYVPFDIGSMVREMRAQLDLNAKDRAPFDMSTSAFVYQFLFNWQVKDNGDGTRSFSGGGSDSGYFSGKKHLLFVLNGEISSLPPQVLLTDMPFHIGPDLKAVDDTYESAPWMAKTHSITVLPSVDSLSLMRSNRGAKPAAKPLVAYADPAFADGECGGRRSLGEFSLGRLADVDALRRGLPCLPGTAKEVRAVSASLGNTGELFLGGAATETAVKSARLDQYRVVYFATHGLVADETSSLIGFFSEPALALTIPGAPTDLDDGLLTASEVTQLHLNADWVVLSACNTASSDTLGGDALSGLALAFFYAGARSVLATHWYVDDNASAELMTRTFAYANAHPKERGAEALRQAMLSVMSDPQHAEWADPVYWAPFILVGEPGGAL